MEKFGGKYRVPSNRMPIWDYGGNGMYFVTLLVKNRACIFGYIQNKQMVLNQWGQMAYDEWTESMKIRGELTLDAFVVMPNHLHAIVIIEGRGDRRPDGLVDAPDGGSHVKTHGRACLPVGRRLYKQTRHLLPSVSHTRSHPCPANANPCLRLSPGTNHLLPLKSTMESTMTRK